MSQYPFFGLIASRYSILRLSNWMWTSWYYCSLYAEEERGQHTPQRVSSSGLGSIWGQDAVLSSRSRQMAVWMRLREVLPSLLALGDFTNRCPRVHEQGQIRRGTKRARGPILTSSSLGPLSTVVIVVPVQSTNSSTASCRFPSRASRSPRSFPRFRASLSYEFPSTTHGPHLATCNVLRQILQAEQRWQNFERTIEAVSDKIRPL